MTLIIASSTAGCLGEKYLDKLTGEDSDDHKDRKCDKKCLKKCMETEEFTEEECEQKCLDEEDRIEGSSNATAETSTESEMTQDDCEEKGGTWTEAQDRDGEYYCDTGEEESNDATEEDASGESTDDTEREEEKCYDDNQQEVPCEQ